MGFEKRVLEVCTKTLDGDCHASFFQGTLVVSSAGHGVPINTLLHDLRKAGFEFVSATAIADDKGEEWLIDFMAAPQ
jgi:hypothetical protein